MSIFLIALALTRSVLSSDSQFIEDSGIDEAVLTGSSGPIEHLTGAHAKGNTQYRNSDRITNARPQYLAVDATDAEQRRYEPGLRHEASNPHANEIIQHWSSDRIASARPRDLTVDGTDPQRRFSHSPPPHHRPHHDHSRSTLQAADSDVSNDHWDNNWGGQVQNAVGRIYFEMNGIGYVCSGTVVQDDQEDRSIILTAAHCVYDDAQKQFATNVLFIPNQDETTGSGTDTNCLNDPLGCWAASFGVADTDWASRTFPQNIPWDYAMYVVPASGAHAGPTQQPDGTIISDSLEEAAGSLSVSFDSPSMVFTWALGYSFSDDPHFMYCAQQLEQQSAANYNALWLGGCGLSGGASGGPWIQGSGAADLTVMSVNSWGYNGAPGMGSPRLDSANGGHAVHVFSLAVCTSMSQDDGGILWCDAMGDDPCGAGSGICGSLTTSPTAAATPRPTAEGCTDATFADGSAWHDSDGAGFDCEWYSQGTNCQRYGNDFANGGFTANQACCVCGGGNTDGSTDAPTTSAPNTDAPTAEPTDAPTAEPTPPQGCSDMKLADGSEWHDSEGSEYTCGWYADRDHCEHYGDAYPNQGFTAQQACCICQQPAPTAAPTTSTPTNTPTQAPITCSDLTLAEGLLWHDSEGLEYTCGWYAERDNCDFYGSEWINGGHTANQACCTCGGGSFSMVEPIHPFETD